MNNVDEEAVAFLYKFYEDAKEYVKDSPYYTEYTEEKIHHSMQVIGAMKYIMKHEDTFKNRTNDFIRFAKVATILHDVGRFQEIKDLYDEAEKSNNKNSLWNSRLDHGYYGYEILKNSEQYNDPRIYIPVKHHGHMIEELYEDEEFSCIKDEKLKKEIAEIIFLVRDADKAANYYLLITKPTAKFPNVFKNSYTKEENAKPITPETMEEFTQFQVVGRENVYNYATRYMNILSWVFDINYIPTFDLIIKNSSLSKLTDILYKEIKNIELQSLIENTLADYLNMRYEDKARSLL